MNERQRSRLFQTQYVLGGLLAVSGIWMIADYRNLPKRIAEVAPNMPEIIQRISVVEVLRWAEYAAGATGTSVENTFLAAGVGILVLGVVSMMMASSQTRVRDRRSRR